MPITLAESASLLIIEELSLINRAAQVLYALGEKPADVHFETGEAKMWVEIAQSVIAGDRSTEIRQRLAASMSPVMLEYVATGRMKG